MVMTEVAPELTQESIVDATLRLIQRVGLEAVTMRSLAEELGVSHMASYYHVRNKDSLLRLVADFVMRDVVVPGPELGAWPDRLKAVICSMRDALAPYPGLGPYMLESDRPGQSARRIVFEAIAMLTEFGFDSHEATLAFTTVHNWFLGRLDVESALSPQRRTQLARAQVVVGAPDIPEMGALRKREIFEYGLDVVVAGIASRHGVT